MIRKLFTVTIFAVAIMTNIYAQTKDEAAVANAVEQLRKAMIDGNKADLENIASDKLSYGHSSGLVENKMEFVDKIASGKSDFITIELTDQNISISGKTAIVRHKLHATTNDGGKPGEVRLFILLIFQKEKKQWKLLARQAARQPS